MKIKPLKIGVIGFGNMAEAILAGLIKSRLMPAKHVHAFEPNLKRKRAMQKKYSVVFYEDPQSACHNAQVILVCVKPQNIKEVLTELRACYHGQLVITVVTGIAVKTYQKFLGKTARVIRVMPNTPALIGHGAAVYFANKNCTPDDKKICEGFFSCLGIIIPIKQESQINTVTALSGSGPAFVYQYAKHMIAAAQKLGLPETTAQKLMLQTIHGACQMMLCSGKSPDELTQMVTSKGGTTLAGLETLQKKGFAKIIEACIVAATNRAVELSKT